MFQPGAYSAKVCLGGWCRGWAGYANYLFLLVGVTGFEPATSCSRSKITRPQASPSFRDLLTLKHL